MKQKEIIQKLKEGHYIEWSEYSYTRRIFIYTPDGENWLAQINIKSFEALKEKGILKVESYNDKDFQSGYYTLQRKKIKYVYNDTQRVNSESVTKVKKY